MAKSYAYVGAPSFIGAVEGRLADAGFSQVSDVASADIKGLLTHWLNTAPILQSRRSATSSPTAFIT